MGWFSKPAPACKALLKQATKRWPRRDKSGDGIVPSRAHSRTNPSSDHEVGHAGYNHAVDLTHDPAHGCDCEHIAESIVASRDPRVSYIIFNKRMTRSYRHNGNAPWTWTKYTGPNPHNHHMHISIKDTKQACQDTGAWAGVAVSLPGKKYRVIAIKTALRSEPRVTGKVIVELVKDREVIVNGRVVNGYLPCRHQDHIGWVYEKHLEAL